MKKDDSTIIRSGIKQVSSSSLMNPQKFHDPMGSNGRNQGWVLWMAILPTQENLERAQNALKAYFKSNKQRPPLDVFCFNLIERNPDLLRDPIELQGHDRNLMGQEIEISISTRRWEDNAFAKTANDYKDLMLKLWKALQEAGVQMNHTSTPSGTKAVPSERGLLVPFAYSSDKPFGKRHRTLHQTDFNPYRYQDPLEGMNKITFADLTQYDIDLKIVQREIEERMSLTNNHLLGMANKIRGKLLEINRAYIDLNNNPVPSNWETIATFEGSGLVSNEHVSELEQIQTEFNDPRVVEYINSLAIEDLDIPRCITRKPREMQIVYRTIIHILHEKEALDKDQVHKAIPNCSEQEAPEQDLAPKNSRGYFNPIVEIAIGTGVVFVGAGVGAGIGALVGSFVPVVGTAAGALIGAGVGTFVGLVVDLALVLLVIPSLRDCRDSPNPEALDSNVMEGSNPYSRLELSPSADDSNTFVEITDANASFTKIVNPSSSQGKKVNSSESSSDIQLGMD